MFSFRLTVLHKNKILFRVLLKYKRQTMHSIYILIIRPATLRVCGLFVCPFHRFRKNNEKFFRQYKITD